MEVIDKIKKLIDSIINFRMIINSNDLKQLFEYWRDNYEKDYPPEAPKNYLTTKEAAEKLGMDVSTLWRMDKTGYLKKIKIGSAVRYLESDVLKLLEGKL